MTAFVIWAIVGIGMILLGVYDMASRRAVLFGFWANSRPEGITDVKKYNRAVGALFLVFGVLFILLGLPLLAGQNSPWIVVSILGAMLEAILAMAVYELLIAPRYRKKE